MFYYVFYYVLPRKMAVLPWMFFFNVFFLFSFLIFLGWCQVMATFTSSGALAGGFSEPFPVVVLQRCLGLLN